jgi:HSP20 family protein
MVMALVRTDSFRDVDRLFQSLWSGQSGTRFMTMPMDAYREGDNFVIRIDMPGVNPDSVDLTVEENVLTIRAERPAPQLSDGAEPLISERPYGTFTRQVFLGSNLDTEHIRAEYEAGVLSLTIPVAEQAKPRRIEVTAKSDQRELSG